MKNFLKKCRDYFHFKVGRVGILRALTFLVPFIAIIIKCIMVQGFVTNSNPFILNFQKGFKSVEPFLGYYIAFSAFFVSFALLFRGKGRALYLFLINIVVTIVLIADTWYFRGFYTMPSILSLNQTSNLGEGMTETILSLVSNYDLLLILDIVVFLIIILLTRKYQFKVKRRAYTMFFIFLISSICYIGYLPFQVFVLGNKDANKAYILDIYDPMNTSKYFSPIGYHLYDLYSAYKDSKPYELTQEEEDAIKDFYEVKKENLPNNKYFGMSKGKNLIVIQVESLESFVIGKSINDEKITPVLDNLINTGVYFPNIHEQVNQGTSSDCDLMVNTSMYPVRKGSTFFRFPNTTYNSLPNLLEEEQYETIAIHPDKGSFWNYIGGLTSIGFDEFVDEYSFSIDEFISMGQSDKNYFTQVVPMLKEKNNPFYGFTVTLTNHGPFNIPEQYRVLNLEPELNANELGGYFESVKYTDTEIGNFLKNLDKEGLLDNTVVAIIGDHAGVHKYYNHNIDSLSNKEDWYLSDGTLTVPFIIWSKDMKTGKTFDTIGGQVDIMPTLLYALGIPNEKYDNTVIGRNLLNTKKSFAVLPEGDIVGGNGLSSKEKDLQINMLELCDKMIRSNYFKDK